MCKAEHPDNGAILQVAFKLGPRITAPYYKKFIAGSPDNGRQRISPLTAAIRGYGYKFFVKWYRYLVARLEHYLQNGTVSRRPG